MKIVLKAMFLVGALVVPFIAAAQDYPSKQVSLVIPYPPGGSNDTIGRYLADRLSKHWKQTVLVENRPGAGTAIGTAHVTQSKPDGYKLLFVSASFTTNAAMQENLPFDPIKDLQPVAMAGLGDRFVLTGSRVPMPTLQDVQREGKAKTLFYGTTGVGTNAHLSGELLNDTLGIEMKAVHYPGGAAAMTDLGGGRIDVYTAAATDVLSGIGKPIAVLGDKRSPALPNVPTVVEIGFPEAQAPTWWGVFAPANTPKDVLAKINKDIGLLMSSPEANAFLAQQGAVPSAMGVEEFTTTVKSEIKKWTSLIKKHGIKAN